MKGHEMNLTTATPVEIDTVLADLYRALMIKEHDIESAELVILGYAGMREWVRPPNYGKGHYRNTGTFAEARAKMQGHVDAYTAERGLDYDAMSEQAKGGIRYYEYVPTLLSKHDAAVREVKKIRLNIAVLDAEFDRRGGWTRKFLVTSSSGHLHSTMSCSTCRPTTTYGWWPTLSGMTEAEAITALKDRADALCSVCFPTAPVAGGGKRKHITKAQALKIASQA